MGHSPGVRPASATSIEIVFAYRGVRCRERLRLQPTPTNLKRAARHRAAILEAIEAGTFDYGTTFPGSPRAEQFARTPGQRIRLDDYLEDWLTAVKPGLKASTWTNYRKIIRGHLIPAFGAIRLSDLRRAHVRAWAAERAFTAKTLGNVLSPLRVALDDAVEDELIHANVLAGYKIKRATRAHRRPRPDPFERDERAAILDALDGQGLNLIRFAFWSGLRTSELVALEWGDVDWIGETVHVTRAMTQCADEAEGTKTAAGERRVKLLPEALGALRAQKAFTFLANGVVFENPRTGKPWAGDQPIRKTLWEPALRRAGVRYRKPYSTRHTYAAMMLQAGEDVRWVADQLGHTSWEFTARTYDAFITRDAPDAGNKAAAMWAALCQHGDEKAR